METEAYTEMAATEADHWWFCARRTILESIIRAMPLPPTPRILEVGSGTGGNLAMLSRYGDVCAIEMDADARRISEEKYRGQFSIRAGSCPDNLPLGGELFDLICMFDVLEHIDRDTESLAALRKHLAPGGYLLVTVPAYPWLWSAHDVFLHHQRRYTASTLNNAFARSGLHVNRITYFNTWLLPLAALARMKDRLARHTKPSGTTTPSPPVNAMLRTIFASERHMLKRVNLPVGVSLLGIASA